MSCANVQYFKSKKSQPPFWVVNSACTLSLLLKMNSVHKEGMGLETTKLTLPNRTTVNTIVVTANTLKQGYMLPSQGLASILMV